jgi:alcohol dehydrogenase (cytochrome c)
MMNRLLLATALATTTLSAQVTFDRILHSDKEPQNWLSYSGNVMGQRYSTLAQIDAGNVKNLEMKWAYQVRSTEKFENTPLVVDGVMYITQAPNDVIALDAVTGRTFWVYNYVPSTDARPCCGRVNRGVAILGSTLYMATIDAHLIALDATNGHPIWNVEVGSAKAGYAMTLAPQIVKDKVIVGVAGGEYGIRGYIAAFDAKSGKEDWRF